MTREEAIKQLKGDITESCATLSNQWEKDEEAISVAISALSENKGEWIPVSERLPEVDTCVLTSIIPEEVSSYRVVISKFNNESWWTDGTVEAWQPLPDPYKPESEVDLFDKNP